MVNIHAFLGDFQGCGTLRVIYPYLLLAQHMNKFNIKFNCTYGAQYVFDKTFYERMTYMLFQRAATKQQYQIFDHLKKNVRTPRIYEIDDLLINIPKWNMAHDYYSANEKYTKRFLRESRAIIVSTEYLGNVYSKFNENIIVSLNHLPKFIWGERKPKEFSNNKKRILWGGSSNHFNLKGNGGDMDDKLLNFIRNSTDKYQWIFKGGFPNELNDLKGKEIEYHGWSTTHEYPNFLKSLNVDLGIAPLEDNDFNKSKSNIKAIEYSALGIPGVYSNVEPYKNMSCIANNSEEFIDLINTLCDNEAEYKRVQDKDYNTLKDQMYWEENQNLYRYIDNTLKIFNLTLPTI